MVLLYEKIGLNLVPSKYSVRLDNIPAEGDVMVLSEEINISKTNELTKEENTTLLDSDIKFYVRLQESNSDHNTVIGDLIGIYESLKNMEGSTYSGNFIISVSGVRGPTYLGRDSDSTIYSMLLRVQYTV